MPTSSVVWWPSISTSPSAIDREVEQAVARELIEHVVRNGSGVFDRCWPLPSRSISTRICVSLVLRSSVALRAMRADDSTQALAPAHKR